MHFTFDELACKCGKPYPHEWRDQRGRETLLTAHNIRDEYGSALKCISGYRCEECNADARARSISKLMRGGLTRAEAEQKTGVAKDSQHMYGRAMDIRPAGMPKLELWTHEHFARVTNLWLMTHAMHGDGQLPLLGGLGRYKTWVHIDTRPERRGRKLARWSHGIV